MTPSSQTSIPSQPEESKQSNAQDYERVSLGQTEGHMGNAEVLPESIHSETVIAG